MALSHITKIFAVQDCEIAQLIADPAAANAPAAPSTPSAPTATGAGSSGGATSRSYKLVLSNGVDSAQSTALVNAAGQAALSAAAPIILNFTTPAAGQIMIAIATVRGEGTGVIGTANPGETTITDDGSLVTTPANTSQHAIRAYVANTTGVLYNRKLKIPGIKSIEVTGSVKNSMLRGDFTLLDSFSVLTDLKVAFNFAKSNWDAYAVMVGGTVTDSGSTPNQIARWRLKRTTANDTTNRFHYFSLEGQSVGADPVNGDVHFLFPKMILEGFPKLGMAEEDYETFAATAAAIPRINDDVWMDAVENETSVEIGVGA